LISDFKDTKANDSEAENWENKQEMMIERKSRAFKMEPDKTERHDDSSQ
jgi:hypothetical protein